MSAGVTGHEPDGADVPAGTSRSGSTAARRPAAADSAPAGGGLSRRGLLGLLGAGAAGIAAGGAGGYGIAAATGAGATSHAGSGTQYPFNGDHQAGIVTPAQDRLHFATFDVREGTTREELVELLQDWSYASSRLVQGLDVSASGAVGGSPLAPPDDTGEAMGLPPSALTITFGFGPTLFVDGDGVDRFGLASKQPAKLTQLPRFSGDALESELSGGDLCIQACADDPQVAVHAIRNLTRIGFGRVILRWSQLGFGRTSSTSTSQATPRNLFGFKDGTANVKAEETSATAEHVWVAPGDGADWLAGGSFLVARRIRMMIESWDRVRLEEQEQIIGRDKRAGAPLSGGEEFTEPDFVVESNTTFGQPAIDANSHVALSHPMKNAGARLLRRGYNFVDGNDELGRLNAGLFFLSYQRDPEQFIRVQQSLSTDLLNEYIKHTGSGIWAIPPGAREGGFVGETLFA